jgi:hypothetical protein
MRGNDEAMIVAGEWMAKAENDLKSAASGGKSADCSLRSLRFRMDGRDETLVTVADTVRLAAVLALAYHGVARERKMV